MIEKESENLRAEAESDYIGKAVAVDERKMGRKVKKFRLSDLVDPEPMLGVDKFTEVYFRTGAGEIHCIRQHSEVGKFIILDAMINRGKKEKAKGSMLTPEDTKGELITDRPFEYGIEYGRKIRTAPITEIVATTDRWYDPDEVKKHPQNSIRKEFWKKVNE